jgi:V/A-type H+/Na+-transporting ATPase subunit E
MSIEQIKDKILKSSIDDARRIFDKGRMESRDKVYEAERLAELKIKAVKETAAEDAARLKSRRESMANLEARKMKLSAKQEIISECFNDALSEIRQMPKQQYVQLLAAKLGEIGVKEGEILLNKKDLEGIGKDLLSAANANGGRFTLSRDTIEAAGGFILRTGRIEMDSTLEMMVSSVKEKAMAEVVSALFG